MHLKKVHIENFRNFNEINMYFEKGFHTLIGANNIGKSNVLHAIRLVLDQNMTNFYRRLNKEDFNNLIEINQDTYVKISVELCGDDLMELPNFPLIRTGDVTAEISYFFAHKSKFYSNYVKDELDFDRDFSWRLYGGKDLNINDLKNMTSIPQNELEGLSVNLITDFRDIFKHLSSKKNTLFRDYLKSRPSYLSDKEVLEEVLSTASENLNEKPFIGNITQEISDKNEHITSKFFSENYYIDFDSINDTDLWDSISLYFKVNNNKLPVSKLGLGQKNILFLALYILYLENNELENILNILLIEEPEAHLHPQLQRLLFKKLQDMEKTQVIMTSHSAHIASDVEYKNMTVLYRRSEMAKSFTPFSQTSLEPNTEKLLKRYFDVTRSEMFFAEKVVLVEGVTEQFVIESIMKYKYDYDLLDNNVSVISIHGRHFHSFLPFFSNNNFEIEVSVLMDGDQQNDDDSDFVGPAKEFENSTLNRIRVFNSSKTLELELFPDKNVNSDYLKKVFENLDHSKSYENLMQSNGDWDTELMNRIKNTISKGRFAQQLSLEIDANFITPQYIIDLSNHLKGV